MRKLVLLVALFAAAPLAGQQAPPVFRSNVSLVLVDATVLDRDGRPVSGLTASDFEIKLNGKVQPIRTLTYVQAVPTTIAGAAPAVAAEAGGRQVVTNAVPADDPRILIVMVDDMSFPAGGGMRTLAAARAFVARQPSAVLVGVATTTGAVALNPTLDRTAVDTALRRIVGQFIDPRRPSSPANPSVGISEAIEIAQYNNTSARDTAVTRECLDGGRAMQTGEYGDASNAIGLYQTKCATDLMAAARLIASQTTGSTNRQVASIADTVHAMEHAPGLKQIIIVTQGIATTRELNTVFRPVTGAAAAAGVLVSVLMDEEEDNDAANQARVTSEMVGQRLADTGITSRRREDRRMFGNALQSLADMAGGTFERIVTNPDGAFARAAVAGSAVYRIGVEAPAGASSSSSLEVSASVKREGVTVHANRHAVRTDAVADTGAPARVSAALKRGVPHFAVPMRVGVTRRAAEDGQVEVSVGLAVPASVPGPLKVTLGLLSESGAFKQGSRVVPMTTQETGYVVTMPMPVAAGTYRLRVAVEDGTGQVGSVDSELQARLTPMGPLLVSDLLTWIPQAGGRREFVSVDTVPSEASQLGAGIELTRPAGAPVPPGLQVTLSLHAAGGAAIATAALSPRADGDRLRADATLPIAGLPAGEYVIRAVVTSAGERLGEVSARIRR